MIKFIIYLSVFVFTLPFALLALPFYIPYYLITGGKKKKKKRRKDGLRWIDGFEMYDSLFYD